MKKRTKYLVATAVAIAVIAGIVMSMSKPKYVETVTISPQTAELYFTEIGDVVADHMIDVYACSSGKLIELNVSENEQINKGDIICQIDTTDHENRIAQLENEIKGYRAQKATTHISEEHQLKQKMVIEQSKKDREDKLQKFEHAKVLYENGAISKSDYDDAALAYETAASSLEQSKTDMTILEKDETSNADYYHSLINISQVSIEQLRKQIEDCTVRSPLSGVITALPIKSSTYVTTASPVATINSIEDNRIEVLVNTNDIDMISMNQQVELILRRRDADKILTGVVTSIDHTATIKTSKKGNEERMVKVTVKPDLTEEFKPGFDVDVKFIYDQEKNQLMVPKSAVFNENGNNFVWVVEKDKLVSVKVELGKTLRSDTVIKSGLTEGSMVVTDGNGAGLKNGMSVRTTPEF